MMLQGHSRKRCIHILLPLFIGSVIAYLDRVNIAYAALTMNSDLGFSAEVFGMGAGIFYVGYVLFEVPGAVIAERWSARIWLSRIMITWGSTSALMAFVRVDWQFYLVRFLIGAAEASYYPVAYASVIPRWFTPEERPRAIAVMLTSLQVSAIIGSPLAGLILGISAFGMKGWQLLFIVEALPALVFGIVLYFWLADWPRHAGWLSEGEKRYLTSRYEDEVKRKSKARSYSLLEALRDPEVLRLSLIYFLWITGFWGFNYWMPTVLSEMTGWNVRGVGWALVPPMTFSLIGMLFIAHSSSRTGEKRWHGAVPLFLGCIGLGIGIFARDPILILALVCLAAIGAYGSFGVWWSYPTSFLSGTAAAGAVGLINSFGNLGGYAGSYLTGVLKDTTGSFQPAYVALAGSMFLSGALILTLRRNRD